MTDYLSWYRQTKELSFALEGQPLKSHNEIEVVVLDSGEKLLKKTITDHVVYIPRLKILGEVVYSLLDYHLNPGERVTPNVCPVSKNQLWRQFIDGLPGETWRGELYRDKGSLEAADLVLVDRILENRFAQRIALLDFIILCQDRSARNWIEHNNRFWAVDNGIFWPWRGRHTDKWVIKCGDVDHLKPPMEALVSYDHKFSFQIGIFTSLFAGNLINAGLLAWLFQLDWARFFDDLRQVIEPLEYPVHMLADWRFDRIQDRAAWLLRKRRFPAVSETGQDEWQGLISQPLGRYDIWGREWER